MTNITAIINAHREEELVSYALRSAMQSIASAEERGISASLMVVADRPNDRTMQVIRETTEAHDASIHDVSIHEVDFGDLSLSRNFGVERAQSEAIAFLDADDLWCKPWLRRSWLHLQKHGEKTICHPELNLVFGVDEEIFPHPNQDSDRFSLDSLRCTNYWTALSMARREIYLDCPYHENRIADGFGYEDWAWNCDTIHHGYVHRAVPKTTHFLRRAATKESLRLKTNKNFCLRSSSKLFMRPKQDSSPTSTVQTAKTPTTD